MLESTGRERRAWRVPGILALLPALLPALSFAESQRFTATAYDLKTGRVLYTEQYDVQTDNGRWLSGTTRYLSPNGQQIAERKFDFAADRHVPVYTLEQSVPQYSEGITRIEKTRVDLYADRAGDRKSGSVERVKELVADCGAQAYVLDHLDTLQSGGTLHFTLAVPGKIDSFALRARKDGDVEINGAKAIRVRIELDSMLRLILPKLELTLDPQNRKLLEYTGLSNLKDPATKKAYAARIVFSYQ